MGCPSLRHTSIFRSSCPNYILGWVSSTNIFVTNTHRLLNYIVIPYHVPFAIARHRLYLFSDSNHYGRLDWWASDCFPELLVEPTPPRAPKQYMYASPVTVALVFTFSLPLQSVRWSVLSTHERHAKWLNMVCHRARLSLFVSSIRRNEYSYNWFRIRGFHQWCLRSNGICKHAT